MKPYVDLNCDMGESYSIYHYGLDKEMMPLITSANVACGFHAGDPQVMRQTVELAEQYGVRVGAHIGLPDRLGFGRRSMQLTPGEMYDYTLYQIGALDAFLQTKNMRMSHVKLHGALYMMASEQKDLADAFVQAIASLNSGLEIYALPHSQLDLCATASNLPVLHEYFADRPYIEDRVKMFGWSYEEIGTPEDAKARIEKMLSNPAFTNIRTICVHSDTKDAHKIMKSVKETLKSLGYETRN